MIVSEFLKNNIYYIFKTPKQEGLFEANNIL